MDSKIKYTMTDGWYTCDDAVKELNLVSILSDSNHRVAFSEPSFTGSWGRGGPRTKPQQIICPITPMLSTSKQVPNQVVPTGRGRGRVLLDALDQQEQYFPQASDKLPMTTIGEFYYSQEIDLQMLEDAFNTFNQPTKRGV